MALLRDRLRRRNRMRTACCAAAAALVLATSCAHVQPGSTAQNMTLLAHQDLQGRSAYQPVIKESRGRWIAYIGHHGGKALNTLTGREEDNGTSIVDVTDPRKPRLLAHIPGEPGQAESGGAQMVRVCNGSELPKGDKSKVYMLRNFGNQPTELHGMISTGPKGNRIYFGYGTNKSGVLQIVDRQKLISGPPEPTPANLLAPQVGRFDMNVNNGAHTTLPVPGIQVAEFAKDKDGGKRDIVVVVDESLANECTEPRQMVWIVDATDERTPVSIATYTVPESHTASSGGFCSRGGRFGSHSSNENQPPMYAGHYVFVAWFNAGVRALDISDPYHPREAGYYIPATTDKTDKRCVKDASGAERCKVAIQTNNLEVDDRGYIYAVDRANTGLHIIEFKH